MEQRLLESERSVSFVLDGYYVSVIFCCHFESKLWFTSDFLEHANEYDISGRLQNNDGIYQGHQQKKMWKL